MDLWRMWFLCASLVSTLWGVSSRPSSSAQRLCGEHLSEILRFICNGSGYHQHVHHQMGTSDRSLNQLHSRVTRNTPDAAGIVSECCKRPCSYETLASYCSKPIEVQDYQFPLEITSTRRHPSSLTSTTKGTKTTSGFEIGTVPPEIWHPTVVIIPRREK